MLMVTLLTIGKTMKRTLVTQKAIDIAGGPGRLASMLGLTQGAISQWKRVPPSRVQIVSHLTGIAPELLRPDIFAPMPAKKRRA